MTTSKLSTMSSTPSTTVTAQGARAIFGMRSIAIDYLARIGVYIAPLGLRIILAWEFFEAGLMKFQGSNWFAGIQEAFPFPFNLIPTEISWALATYTEIIGGAAILLGLATRFFSFSLIILTIVATAAVHWPDTWDTLAQLLQGYSISDKGFGNYKLPVIYLVMFLPLLFHGPGKLSLDAVISRYLARGGRLPHASIDATQGAGAH